MEMHFNTKEDADVPAAAVRGQLTLGERREPKRRDQGKDESNREERKVF